MPKQGKMRSYVGRVRGIDHDCFIQARSKGCAKAFVFRLANNAGMHIPFTEIRVRLRGNN